MSEPELQTCASCLRNTVIKVPSVFVTTNVEKSDNKKVGDTTKTGIEENREILKQMQKEARSNEFKLDD
tara:strand:+ start:494 stop:700 length:207 start_codon:yes stop_codon:yes gene_type:complete